MGRKRNSEEAPPANQGEVLPPARHVMPLRKPSDVTMEQKRIYRAALNGKIGTDELTRYTYALKEIRAGLEADAPPQIDQTTRGPCVEAVIINGVPHGTFLPQEEIDRLNSQFIEPPPAHIAGPPMLKVFDNVDDDDSEQPPPQAS